MGPRMSSVSRSDPCEDDVCSRIETLTSFPERNDIVSNSARPAPCLSRCGHGSGTRFGSSMYSGMRPCRTLGKDLSRVEFVRALPGIGWRAVSPERKGWRLDFREHALVDLRPINDALHQSRPSPRAPYGCCRDTQHACGGRGMEYRGIGRN